MSASMSLRELRKQRKRDVFVGRVQEIEFFKRMIGEGPSLVTPILNIGSFAHFLSRFLQFIPPHIVVTDSFLPYMAVARFAWHCPVHTSIGAPPDLGPNGIEYPYAHV